MNIHLGDWDQLCSCREEESSPPVEESFLQMADEALLFSNVNNNAETSYHHRNLVQPSVQRNGPPRPMTRSQSARTLSNRRSPSLAIEEMEELLFQTCMGPELAAMDDRQLVEAAVQQWGPSLQQPIQPEPPSRSSASSSCSQHPLQIGTGLQYLSPARKGGTNPKRRASGGRRSKSTIARRKKAEH